jgi:hypothetical protein
MLARAHRSLCHRFLLVEDKDISVRGRKLDAKLIFDGLPQKVGIAQMRQRGAVFPRRVVSARNSKDRA